MRRAYKVVETYDPLRGLPDGPILITEFQARVLRYLAEHGSIHALFGDSASELAEEYRMDRWLRAEVLVDPHNKLTRKAVASLSFFDHPPPPQPLPQYARYETRREEEEEEEEAIEGARVDQRIRVALPDDGEIIVRVVELAPDEWFAETLVAVAGSRRKKRVRIQDGSKADVLHRIIHRASEMRAHAYARLHS